MIRLMLRGSVVAILIIFQIATWAQPYQPSSDEREASFLFKQGLELLSGDQLERARELFSKALSLEPERLEIRPYYAQSLFKLEQYEAALEQLELYLAQEPADSKVAFFRVRVLTALARYGQALDALNLLTLGMANSSWEWQNLKGFLEEKQGHDPEAEEAYLKAASMTKTSFEPQTSLVALYLKRGRIDDAQAVISELLAAAPDDPQVINALATILARKDPGFDPRALWDRLQGKPLAFELRYNLAASLAQQGDYDAAAVLAGDLVDRYPDNARASFLYGRVLLERGELKDAGQYLLATRDRLDRSIELLATMGAYSYQTGNYTDAVGWFKLAAEGEPGVGKWQHDLSLALSRLDRIDEAVSASRQAVSLDPNSASINYQLALVLERSGKAAEAATVYRRFLEIEPDSERAAIVREHLVELKG